MANPKIVTSTTSKDGPLPLLQQRLIMNRFFCGLFGFKSFQEMRDLLKGQQEGWQEDGHSSFFRVLEGLRGLKIPLGKLSTYDLRIKNYVQKLNRLRSPTVELKYFQYLAVLFAEIYLDRLFNERERFVADLTDFIGRENAKLPPNIIRYDNFNDTYLSKMACWMATGSGKTFVMHINIWQYSHYSKGKVEHDSILLVTPNEGLSVQHLKQLRLSGIPAIRYGETKGFVWGNNAIQVIIIEITKLTEKKKGSGLSVEIETFGSNNLLLVDEGHRGASGEVWRELRRRLAENSFTFEYSATFGQIVNGASIDKRPGLLDEYSKAILFDYSYPHFYYDGFGKDYWITNLKDQSSTFNYWMLLGNLLSFYEQLIAYAENSDELSDNNLESPLWVFVGHSVTGGKSREDKESLTDIEEILVFLDNFLRSKEKWVGRIAKALNCNTGLKNKLDRDIFEGQFLYLKNKNLGADSIYSDIIQQVFGGKVGDMLYAAELKTAVGEIGLRVGAHTPYFGVINIGDVSGLHKLIEGHGIAFEDDVFSDSLFNHINEFNSTVTVLIGARKFMEGWDSFRVSSMGLMNIGRGEGSQIIQLFGRGVRLWGKGNSLKRSTLLELNDQLPCLRLLETLNVFGVRANYMAQFREYLRQEGIETDFREFAIPVRSRKEFLDRELQMLRLPKGLEYSKQEALMLELDSSLRITLDMVPRFEEATSGQILRQTTQKIGGADRSEEIRENMPFYDFDRIQFNLIEFIRGKGFHNLIITKDILRKILKQANFQVLSPEGRLLLEQYPDLQLVESTAVAVLQKYIMAYYGRARKAWEISHLQIKPLSDLDPNMKFSYVLRVKTSDKTFVQHIAELVGKADDIYKKDVINFPNIHFDRHLYQPLMTWDKQERIEASPPGLNFGETQFVIDLRSHVQSRKNALKEKELYLLRNLTRGKGIGFFQASEGEAFYPDFILWILSEGEQRIAFIDPHGMRNVAGIGDQKLHLHEQLKNLKPLLQRQCLNWKVQLTSFIIAPPPQSYEELGRNSWLRDHTKEEFERTNVLFGADPDYIDKLFANLLSEPSM